ncbi:MAG: ferrous iron transport protein B [Prevotella sp.]|nr:ferrous iron transport protein B [Candidatus Prevotella equi]
MKLSELNIGQSARVCAIGGDGALRQHFLDMGIIPGAVVTLRKFAPMGDPMQLVVQGYELTLRKDDAAKITVNEGASDDTVVAGELPKVNSYHHHAPHPGYGEPHVGDRKPEVESHGSKKMTEKNITFALAGNQNCGKTTLFNQLTGANQHVGNFPGVTVDQKSGVIRGHSNATVVDLPGIYSLSPYTTEEIVSRDYLLSLSNNADSVGAIINIVDSTNIERNLYLTMQLMELGLPMVLALNFMDEMENNGGTIDVNRMEQLLGIPVVPITASKNQGVDELVSHAIHVAKYHETPARQDFCSPEDHKGAVHRCLHAIMHLVEDHAERAGIPLRFATAKLVEGDHLVMERLDLSINEQKTIEHILKQMEEERGMDRSAAMADMRYTFIERLCSSTVVHPKESKEQLRSSLIDRVLTGRWTAIPTFLAIMAVIFWLTFDVIGGTMQEWLEGAIEWFTDVTDATMQQWNVDDTLRSLIIDGIYAGVGSVASFVPIIVTLFFFLSMLEDSGYMARIAFVMDRPLRRLGLSGRSIVPLLIGFGCSVPAVMSSRTLPSHRDRCLTVMLTPFMSCTAKLPIYAFFCAAFFPDNAAIVMCGLYLLGIVVGIICALLIRVVFRGEAVPFVMELPNYRMPGIRTTVLLLWEKARDFIERAFTVIFMASIVIWFMQSFSFHLQLVDDSSQSILGQIASVIAPLFAPLGFGDWRLATALIGGFMAKESVVSTLIVLLNGASLATLPLEDGWALPFLVFCLLYTPCVAAIASIRREIGTQYALAVVIGQCLIAYVVAWLV